MTSKPASKVKRRKSTKWDRMTQQLKQYHKKHGHSLVSVEENAELANWCKTVRRNYSHQVNDKQSSAGRSALPDYKLELLEELKFVWNVQTFIWNKSYQQMCAFRATHGHCHLPEGHALRMWAHNQRCTYRNLLQGRASPMPPDRFQALSAIGFFDTYRSLEDQWKRRYDELVDFHQAFGHANVPEDYSENYQLGQWVMNQRLAYKRYIAGLQSPLTTERISALESIDFRWNVHSYQWFRMLERLRTYAETHGDVRITGAEHHDVKLWVIQQRHAYQRKAQGRQSSLTDQRQQALESIPHFEWKLAKKAGPSKDDWEELFAGIREKGIAPGMRPKQHWFEGQSLLTEEIKDIYTDEDLLDLWNMEDDEEEKDKDI